MFEKVAPLLESVTGADKDELITLNDACLDRMASYKKSPTKALKGDWDAAREGLRECVERLWAKYFPEQAPAADPQVFDRQKDAFAWLKSKGYKVSTGKFSGDWNNGKVRVHQGRVALQDLLEYAAGLDVDHKKVATAEARQARKDDLDIKIKEEQLLKIQIENRKLDRRWVLSERRDEEVCVWTGRLRQAFEYHLNKNLAAMIHACGGNPARLAEVQAIADALIAAASNEIANSEEITVDIEDLEDDQEQEEC